VTRKPSGSLLVSVALHLLFGAALIYVLSIPFPLREILVWTPPAEQVEHIQYVTVTKPGPANPGRSGGDGHPVREHAPVPRPRVVAPSTVPTQIPPTPPAVQKPIGGSGPVVGAGGPTVGIVPSFPDSRLWAPPGPGTSMPKGLTESLDSVLAVGVQAFNDSMANVASHAGRKPGDWTVEHNGQKYGIDQKHIYIGPIKIPTAILALLPLNIQGNPTDIRRERALEYMHTDIMYQAQQAMNEEEFRDAVRKLRERKQREHDAALRAKKKQIAGKDDPGGKGEP
jgi:hypothetical protein